MYKKQLFMMVIIGSCLLIGTMKSGTATSVEELEQRLDGLETKVTETCTATHEVCKTTEDLKVALEKYQPAYVSDVCEGKIKFGGRIDGMVQYLSGTNRDELGVVGRLWFDARAKVVPDQLDFITEFNSAGGNNIGAGLPSNEITIDRSAFNDLGRGNINLYKAHTVWKPVKGLQIAAGIMDWLNHEDPTGTSGDVGFDNSDVTICEG